MTLKGLLKSTLALACTVTMLAPLSGCRADASGHSVYRSAFESDVPSLDPIQIGDTQSHDVGHNLYNGLVKYRPKITGPNQSMSDLVPDLAESWEVSKDGRTYTFHLRKDAKFHNGRSFEASDVKYSIERLANPKNASKGLWTLNALALVGLDQFQKDSQAGKDVHLDSVKVIDKYTVSLTLQDVIPFAPHVLAMSYYYIVPREEVEKWGDQFSFHANGTGPFMLKEWKTNQKLILVKNPDYFDKGVPMLEELRYYIVPDENIRLLWFQNGELEHLEPPIPAASFDRVLSDPKWNAMGDEAIRKVESINDQSKTNIIKDHEWTIQYVGMDTSSAPFNDKLVRKAFNYAINKRKIIDVVRNGRGIPAKGVLPDGFPGFKADRTVPYPFDLKKAKELMAQAGWRDTNNDGILDKDGKPFKISFWHNQSAIYAMLGAAIQADLRDLGIDIDVRSLEWASYINKVKPKVDSKTHKVIPSEAKLFRFGWAADYPDPDNYLWTLFNSKNIGQDNSTSYNNPAYDQIVNKARKLVNWDARKKLYQQAEDMIIDDAPWIFLYTNVEYKLVQPYVHGQQMPPLNTNELSVVSMAAH